MRRVSLAMALVAVLAAGCGDDEGATTPSSTSSTATTTTTTTTTTVPAPVCEEAVVLAVVDEAIATARLSAGGEWSTSTTGNQFDERTLSGDVLAERLALDCGVKASHTTPDGAERLLLAAWSGPRMAFTIQATDQPSTPYTPFGNLFLVTEEVLGEFLADDMSLWAGTMASGENLIVGHVDYNLGVMAKGWQATVPPLPDAEPTIEAERYAIATLAAAGQRNASVADEAQFGTVVGVVQFISPAGQINVVEVAPEGTFDPNVEFSLHGTTTVETIAGTEVRVTEPAPDDLAQFGAELGWSCDDYVWILDPPINGTVDEMRDVARAVIETEAC